MAQFEADDQEDLAAVLDGADVSERVRAAIAHALTMPDPLSSYADALAARYATERERRSGRNGPPAAGHAPGVQDPRRRWTLHLSYLAGACGRPGNRRSSTRRA